MRVRLGVRFVLFVIERAQGRFDCGERAVRL